MFPVPWAEDSRRLWFPSAFLPSMLTDNPSQLNPTAALPLDFMKFVFICFSNQSTLEHSLIWSFLKSSFNFQQLSSFPSKILRRHLALITQLKTKQNNKTKPSVSNFSSLSIQYHQRTSWAVWLAHFVCPDAFPKSKQHICCAVLFLGSSSWLISPLPFQLNASCPCNLFPLDTAQEYFSSHFQLQS